MDKMVCQCRRTGRKFFFAPLLHIGTGNLPNMEESDTLPISNSIGWVGIFESLDIAKKYPINMATVKNITETFIRICNHFLYVGSCFLA